MSNNSIFKSKNIKNFFENIKKYKDFLSIYEIKQLELEKILLKKDGIVFDDIDFNKIKF